MSLWGDRRLEIDVGDIRPVSVAFTSDELVVTLADGRKIATPSALGYLPLSAILCYILVHEQQRSLGDLASIRT